MRVPSIAAIPAYGLTLAVLSLGVAGCGGSDDEGPSAAPEEAQTAAPASVVSVIARDFAFQAPDSIPSGWTTFRFLNDGAQTHFFVLDHLPAGRGLDDFASAVAAPFDSAWGGLQAGTMDKAQAGALLERTLPEWFADVEQTGGVGMLAPGDSAQATVQLEPGTYVMECYVKTPDGVFHTALGMARELTVMDGMSASRPPSADLEIRFADGGMTAPASVNAGRHTVAVHYDEQPEAGLENDVSVARLQEGQSPQDLVPWMDWMNLEGLQAPAPAEFLGGVQEMPAGGTAYFTLNLTPGRYAWISENAERGMVQEFTVQ